tara:strand:+ start:3906 stop:8876 length:4971 start_codon:yes stop_codon:yes gene_type:complete
MTMPKEQEEGWIDKLVEMSTYLPVVGTAVEAGKKVVSTFADEPEKKEKEESVFDNAASGAKHVLDIANMATGPSGLVKYFAEKLATEGTEGVSDVVKAGTYVGGMVAGALPGLASSVSGMAPQDRRNQLYAAANSNIQASDAAHVNEDGFMEIPFDGGKPTKRRPYTPQERARLVEFRNAHKGVSAAREDMNKTTAHLQKTLNKDVWEANKDDAVRMIEAFSTLMYLSSGLKGAEAKSMMGAASSGFEMGNKMGGAIIPGTVGTWKALLASDSSWDMFIRNIPTFALEMAPVVKAGRAVSTAALRAPGRAAAQRRGLVKAAKYTTGSTQEKMFARLDDFDRQHENLLKMDNYSRVIQREAQKIVSNETLAKGGPNVFDYAAEGLDLGVTWAMSPAYIGAAVATESIMPIATGAYTVMGIAGAAGILAPHMAWKALGKAVPGARETFRQYTVNRAANSIPEERKMVQDILEKPGDHVSAVSIKSDQLANAAKEADIRPEVVAANNGARLWAHSERNDVMKMFDIERSRVEHLYSGSKGAKIPINKPIEQFIDTSKASPYDKIGRMIRPHMATKEQYLAKSPGGNYKAMVQKAVNSGKKMVPPSVLKEAGVKPTPAMKKMWANHRHQAAMKMIKEGRGRDLDTKIIAADPRLRAQFSGSRSPVWEQYRLLTPKQRRVVDAGVKKSTENAVESIARTLEGVMAADELLEVSTAWSKAYKRIMMNSIHAEVAKVAGGAEWGLDGGMMGLRVLEEARGVKLPRNVAIKPGGKFDRIVIDHDSMFSELIRDAGVVPGKMYRTITNSPLVNQLMDEIVELADDVGLPRSFRNRETTKSVLLDAVYENGMSKLVDKSYQFTIMNELATMLGIKDTAKRDKFFKDNGGRIRSAGARSHKSGEVMDIEFVNGKKRVMLSDAVANHLPPVDRDIALSWASRALNIQGANMAHAMGTRKFLGMMTAPLVPFLNKKGVLADASVAAKRYAEMIENGDKLPLLRVASNEHINQFLPDELKIKEASKVFDSKGRYNQLIEKFAKNDDRFPSMSGEVHGSVHTVEALQNEAVTRWALTVGSRPALDWSRAVASWSKFALTALTPSTNAANVGSNVLIKSLAEGSLPTTVLWRGLKEVEHFRKYRNNKLTGRDKEIQDSIARVNGMDSDLMAQEVNLFNSNFDIGHHNRLMKAARKTKNFAKDTYSMGDGMFRNSSIRKDMSSLLDDLDTLKHGDEIWLEHPHSIEKLMKHPDGFYLEGKRLSDKALMDVLAKTAKKRADDLFVDYRRKGIFQHTLTQGNFAMIGLGAPFFTWAHHAVFGNGGRGILGSAMDMGPRPWYYTNNSKLNQRMMVDAMGLSMRRQAILNMSRGGEFGDTESRGVLSEAFQNRSRWNLGKKEATLIMSSHVNPGQAPNVQMMDLSRINPASPLINFMNLPQSVAYNLIRPTLKTLGVDGYDDLEGIKKGGPSRDGIMSKRGFGWAESSILFDAIGVGKSIPLSILDGNFSTSKFVTMVIGATLGGGVRDVVRISDELLSRHGEIFTDKGMISPMTTKQKVSYLLHQLGGAKWNTMTYQNSLEMVKADMRKEEKKVLESFEHMTKKERKALKDHLYKPEVPMDSDAFLSGVEELRRPNPLDHEGRLAIIEYYNGRLAEFEKLESLLSERQHPAATARP